MDKVVSSRKIRFAPTSDGQGIVVNGNHNFASPTHWSFGQLAALSGVGAKLLRTQCEHKLASLAVDNLNAGMQVIRDVEDVGMMIRKDYEKEASDGLNHREYITLAAATGPKYGRIWNSQVTDALVKRFGQYAGDHQWTVPGFFGKKLDEITKENTTLFASDRDMFVFLADEENRIVLPNRRNGETGSLARGFFVWNSEVGGKSIGIAFFLFDYSCCNRIVWGVEEFQRISIRHTVTAPDRWIEEIHPILGMYAHASATPIEAKLRAAQATKIDKVEDFLAKRNFTASQILSITSAHKLEEDRPIETLWDAVTGITAYARSIPNTDNRIEVETMAGKLIEMAKVETNNKVLAEIF